MQTPEVADVEHLRIDLFEGAQQTAQLYAPRCQTKINMVDGVKHLVAESDGWVLIITDAFRMTGRGFRFDTRDERFEVLNELKFWRAQVYGRARGSVLKSLIGVLLCLLVGCGQSASENSSVEAVIEMDRSSSASVSAPEPVEETLDLAPFSELIVALEDVRKAKRVSGEILLRGDQLVLNQSLQQMELIGGVEVSRDEGKLSSELLRGWLSESGALRLLEAAENVCVVQEDRIGRGDWLQYDWMEQTVMLRGRASVSDAGVTLHGEQFSGRIGNAGRLICEPNAWLELDSLDHLQGG